MNQHDFESSVLHLWMTTRVPLTRANILFFTQSPRRRADKWLDLMVREGVLDIDSDDDGEMVWMVRGSARPTVGAERVSDVLKLDQLSREVGRQGRQRSAGGSSLVPRQSVPGLLQQVVARSGGQKNVLASGALSLLGPIGWMYAGSAREAIPAAVLYFVMWRIIYFLPWIISGPLHSILVAGSVLAGLMYAWQYNRNGHVTPLLGEDGDDLVRRPPRLPGKR